ncbi:MAG: DUF2029 domain-containing protein [Jiangellaceae bacterium]|nr:DUF2029 domain-containing protein [Jiangellaceae bacterium]
MTAPIAFPSRDDPVVAKVSEIVGGPAGRRAVPGQGWWGPVRVALAVACVVLGLGFLADAGCRADGWSSRSDRGMWTGLCYSDVAFLYRERGLADGLVYRDAPVEYPVLTGAVMQVSTVLARTVTGGGVQAQSVRFYDVTAILMGLAALVTVVATARTVPRRPWDAMLVACSPVLLFTATINWDLLAVCLASLSIYAWTRERPVLTGLFVGLGAAAKLYPAVLLGPLLLVALRAPDRGRALRRFLTVAVTAGLTWVVVNLPVYSWAPDGWRTFFTYNAGRGPEFGSPWYALDLLRGELLPDDINGLVLFSAVVLLASIVVLALVAPKRPRLAQLAFLVVAALVLVNKVWSPQYALWLLPLAALARPRLRDVLIWQVGEMVYFVAVWWHLATLTEPAQPLIGAPGYAFATALRIAALGWLVAMVVRDVLGPEHDPVRPYLGPAPSSSTTRSTTRVDLGRVVVESPPEATTSP